MLRKLDGGDGARDERERSDDERIGAAITLAEIVMDEPMYVEEMDLSDPEQETP